MFDVSSISKKLICKDDGIWYSMDCKDSKDSISFPDDGHDNCYQIERDSFWFRHRNECIISVIKNYPPTNNGVMFDIGGGNGFVALGLIESGFDVVLVEPGQRGAQNAKKRGVSSVICATTEAAGFYKGRLPNIGLFDVIEHIEDDKMFLSTIYHLLENGGMVYITVPVFNFLWSKEDESAGHFRRYTILKRT